MAESKIRPPAFAEFSARVDREVAYNKSLRGLIERGGRHGEAAQKALIRRARNGSAEKK